MSRTNLEIQNEDHLKLYLRANKIHIEDFEYSEEDNKYGIKDIDAVKNPYLWSAISMNQLQPPLVFLIEKKPEWLVTSIVSAILQGVPRIKKDCGLSKPMLIKLFDGVVKNSPENMIGHSLDSLLMCTVQGKFVRIAKILIDYINENQLTVNPDGAFMHGGLSEAAKTANMELIHLIEINFPESIKKCQDWPFLNAMKYGLYNIALYFAKQGNDVHAKRDLGYKLLERNDKNGLVPMGGENKEAHDFLMDVYRGRAFI